MYEDLANKVVIVTGGVGGIGRATTEAFLRNGARVAVVDKDRDKVFAFAAEKMALGAVAECQLSFYILDLSETGVAKEMVRWVLACFGRIDILVNIAGGAFGGDIADIDDETYFLDINTNLTLTFRCIREVLAVMKEQGGGVIVNMSSVNSVIGIGEASYSAAKAAINSLTMTTAVRYGRYGIRCNGVAPGTVRTNIRNWRERLAADPEVFGKIAAKIPRKKVADPEEVAALIVFLASNESRLITGQTIVADGGWSLACGTIHEGEGQWWEG